MEVDRLLSEFYQAEMPHPWPQLKLPRAAVRRPVVRFSHSFRRLALAASVALTLVAYWGLAGMVAHPTTSALPDNMGHIGEKPNHRPIKHLVPIERQRTPAGNDAQLFEEHTPGGVVINVIGPSSAKGPR